MNLLTAQIIAVCVTGLYAFMMTLLILKVISYFVPLRVSAKDEEE
jgi:ammonia channel protein AmtB